MTGASYIYVQKLGFFGPPVALTLAMIFPLLILTAGSIYEYKKIPR
jgi:hypothetical protein